jgi:GntR family transcriptional regulator
MARATSEGPGRTLSERLAEALRERMTAGEWAAGEKLPGEHELAREYGVSRATVRTGLQDLSSRGLVMSQRGRGTFVTAGSHGLRLDLRRLESMSETIAHHGRSPGVHYRNIALRRPDAEERGRLRLSEDAEVLATKRSLTADDDVVAFSHDAIPVALLGPRFSATEVGGSLFALLERHGHRAVSAATELHAVHGPDIGWGPRPVDAAYLLLEQVHYDPWGAPVLYARTYFMEGRFTFGLVRHR